MKRAIVSVTNDVSNDQRVHRACMVLLEKGYQVTVVGRIRKWSVTPDLPYKVVRFRLLFNHKAAFYAEFNLRLFFYLLLKPCHLLWANDLDTLLPNYLVSRLRRKPLVYDSHEYFCHVPELMQRKRIRAFWLRLEKWIMPRLRYIITVNESIAECYRHEYQKELLVVRNITIRERAKKALQNLPDRHSLGLPENIPLVILQGAGININRGAEEAILAMRFLDNAKLIILGGGDAWENLLLLTEKEGLHDKVIFITRQPYEKMLQYTAHASVGLSLDKPTNPNYLYSLPNKIFDYIHAGIPILASALPEVQKIVKDYNTGMTISTHEPEEIARTLNVMLTDETRRMEWKKHLAEAAEVLSWENEKHKLEALLDRISTS